MSDASDMLLDALQEREADFGATMTWAANSYPCVGGVERLGGQLAPGGLQFDSDCQVIVRTSVFGAGAQPARKQTISYKAGPDATQRTWRIDNIRTLFGVALILECNDPAAG